MRCTGTILAVSLLAAGACAAGAAGPPEIVVDRTACSHCGMLISEPIYAAAYQAPGSAGRVFDDIRCLIEAAKQETAGELRFWFRDASDGSWIDGDEATFVASADIRTPMSGGMLAYRDPAAAEEAARRFRGRVVRSLPELMDGKGDLQ